LCGLKITDNCALFFFCFSFVLTAANGAFQALVGFHFGKKKKKNHKKKKKQRARQPCSRHLGVLPSWPAKKNCPTIFLSKKAGLQAQTPGLWGYNLVTPRPRKTELSKILGGEPCKNGGPPRRANRPFQPINASASAPLGPPKAEDNVIDPGWSRQFGLIRNRARQK